MAEIGENGYTVQQIEALETPDIYRGTLNALENTDGYISSSELAESVGRPKTDITAFLDVLRNKNYITGKVENGEYFWNSKPEKLEWNNIQKALDKTGEL